MVEVEKELVQKVIHDLEDIYLGSSFVEIMLSNGLSYTFCEKNKEAVTETTIIAMAIQIIAERYGIAHRIDVDRWVDHFEEVVLHHKIDQINKK